MQINGLVWIAFSSVMAELLNIFIILERPSRRILTFLSLSERFLYISADLRTTSLVKIPKKTKNNHVMNSVKDEDTILTCYTLCQIL